MEKRKTKKEIVKMLLNTDLQEQDEAELLDLLIEQLQFLLTLINSEESKMTMGDRIADKISEKAGSWGFIFRIFFLLNRMDYFKYYCLKRWK